MAKKGNSGHAGAAATPARTSGAQKLDRFLGNYLSTMGILLLVYFFVFEFSQFHQGMLRADFNFEFIGLRLEDWGFENSFFTVRELFQGLIGVYAIALVRFYLKYPWIRSKAYIFLRGIIPAMYRDKGMSRATKQAGLAIFLKFFFAPLMINWCLAHVADMAGSVARSWNMAGNTDTFRTLFDGALFWACFQLILFIDTLLFTIGYIIETPALKNRIVSVEPTFFGWFVCLACYPPFNDFTGRFLEWQSNDFPAYQNDTVHLIMNICILILMGVYSWASVALGLKASNLTNRGIIARGPYAYVRHPAYTAKNMAWWIGAMPTIYMAFNNSTRAGLYAVLATAGWTLVYTARALTEERHLMMANNGYQEYKKQVRYRFIPGVI